jgi:hypothetical protein
VKIKRIVKKKKKCVKNKSTGSLGADKIFTDRVSTFSRIGIGIEVVKKSPSKINV